MKSNIPIYDDVYPDEEGFRDGLATVDKSGKRIWIYPTQPKGKYYTYRKWVSYVLYALLFGLPFIKVNGEPYMLLNVVDSKFILFGVNFTTQDFHLFVIGMLILIVFIALFTVVFGRVFCGWVCPQTIFMEMLFRRVEYAIEGDANAQRRLDKSPWNKDKILKKGAKHIVFLLLSAIIAHTFLSYIIGIDEVSKIVTGSISEHWQGFLAMVVFTLVFYGVFSILREQVCTTICPYGRLQSVLLDDNSLAVSYDFERGEPRGRIKKKRKQEASIAEVVELEVEQGDCIDCGLCVRVCPTGIDIRNGTQLECVNCTACMDACDEIMVKVNKPTELIRVDSYNGIKNGSKNIWNTRVMAYSAVLVVLVIAEIFLFAARSPVEVLILRTPGTLYYKLDDGLISNLYNYQMVNKSTMDEEVRFEVVDMPEAIVEPVGKAPHILKNEVAEGAIFIKIPRSSLDGIKTKLKINVYAGDKLVDKTKTNFMGPNKK